MSLILVATDIFLIAIMIIVCGYYQIRMAWDQYKFFKKIKHPTDKKEGNQ